MYCPYISLLLIFLLLFWFLSLKPVYVSFENLYKIESPLSRDDKEKKKQKVDWGI